jgi:TRAP-type C4-dicarboxylate transport system permease small subunit
MGGYILFKDASPLGRLVSRLAQGMAVAGGLALVAMVVLMTASVIGRALIFAGLKPILGDYELVSIGMGFAVFAFLPWVHLERGHAMVTILTDSLPKAFNRWLLVTTDLIMLLVSAFLAWRQYDGTLDKLRYGETTLLLGIPLGWGYALGLIGAVVFVVVSIYVLGRSLSDALARRDEPQRVGGDL